MEQHSIDSRLELVCLAAQLILENGGETYREIGRASCRERV